MLKVFGLSIFSWAFSSREASKIFLEGYQGKVICSIHIEFEIKLNTDSDGTSMLRWGGEGREQGQEWPKMKIEVGNRILKQGQGMGCLLFHALLTSLEALSIRKSGLFPL